MDFEKKQRKTLMIKKYISFLILAIPLFAYNQNNEKTFHHYTDTLIIIGEKLIDKNKFFINREELLENDSLKINQKGLKIISFEMKALALGNSISLTSKSNILTLSMKEKIIKGKIKYKFFYLKNIILQNKNGEQLNPSTKDIKVIFNN